AQPGEGPFQQERSSRTRVSPPGLMKGAQTGIDSLKLESTAEHHQVGASAPSETVDSKRGRGS
ncbi:hypothetical protein Cadr_000016466, partial [Camelus dromedarius]